MATQEDLENAVKRVNALSKAPSTSEMLDLYGLYKQATTGDATGSRPGLFDPKGRAKWDAWSSRKGMSAESARTEYVALAKRLGA
jgi:acyl-CoA-binding protein